MKHGLLNVPVIILATLTLSGCDALSSTESYRCFDEKNPGDVSHASYLKIESYSWITKLWSDSDGHIWLEDSRKLVHPFFDIQKSELQITIAYDEQPVGTLSRISGKLRLVTDYVDINAICSHSNDDSTIQ